MSNAVIERATTNRRSSMEPTRTKEVEDELRQGYAFLARSLRFSDVRWTDDQRQFLGDAGRGEARHSLRALSEMVALCRLAPPHLREMLPELIRKLIHKGNPQDVRSAFTLETNSCAAVEPLQRAFELSPNSTNALPLRDALRAQLNATKAALDAVEAYCQ